jgi:hypothetical protein
MKAFFLTSEFKGSTPSPASGIAFEQGASYKVTVGKITKEASSFAEVTKQVVAYLEGGYYNPAYHSTGDSRYSTSGETMFGIDRKAGGTINTTEAGKKFWSKIDTAQKTAKWKWNYIPPNPLQKELLDSVVQIMKPVYDSNMKKYLADPALQKVIESDGRLLFNFIYACWNGPGWFKGWAREIKKAYKSGKTSSEDLVKYFVALRVTSTNSLISQGGRKIKELVGLI